MCVTLVFGGFLSIIHQHCFAHRDYVMADSALPIQFCEMFLLRKNLKVFFGSNAGGSYFRAEKVGQSENRLELR